MRVWFAVLFAALPAAAQAKLEVRDVQASHGLLGPRRASADYVQGDEVYYRFTVTGAQIDAEGRVRAELHIALRDDKGKVVLKTTIPVQRVLALGGDSFPASATVELGEDFPPGEYELAVEVRDLTAKETASFTRKFTCSKPTEFAVVRLRFSQDPDGRLPAPVGGTLSQTLFVRLHAVGFDRSRGEIDVAFDIQVLDKDGKPVMPRPIRATFHNENPAVVRQVTRLTFKGELGLNRPGEFTLWLSLTDKLAKKTVTFDAPLRVAAP